jgi:UDP-glucuronate 4-epimerase
MKVLVTGCAGFIGYHVSRALIRRGDIVVGIDNLNDYYDVKLKRGRLAILEEGDGLFKFHKIDITDEAALRDVDGAEPGINAVCHLAAQAGVRHSVQHPARTAEVNIGGFLNVLETFRDTGHVVYASSSSVYGKAQRPEKLAFCADRPQSVYAATKRADEMMAHVYHDMYGVSMIGLRYFTVYGPWGRPDMAAWKFAESILDGGEVDIYGEGRMRRDWTYVDDVVRATLSALDKRINDYRMFNVGTGVQTELTRFLEIIEEAVGRRAQIKNLLPMQPGDVRETQADITSTRIFLDWAPETSIEDGLRRFVKWFLDYAYVANRNENVAKRRTDAAEGGAS